MAHAGDSVNASPELRGRWNARPPPDARGLLRRAPRIGGTDARGVSQLENDA